MKFNILISSPTITHRNRTSTMCINKIKYIHAYLIIRVNIIKIRGRKRSKKTCRTKISFKFLTFFKINFY